MVRAKKNAKTDPSFRDMKADYYPVQRTFNLRSSSTEVDYYVLDVARNLSVVNHRLYRQGKTYNVKVDLNPGAVAASYSVYALVDTWYIQKAWQLARARYLEATSAERAVMSKQQIARWEDFRVRHGLSGHAGGELIPAPFSNGLASAADTAGEFEITEIELTDGTKKSFTWGPSSGARFGMLEEYDKSGDTQLSPSTSSADKAYAGTEGDVTEATMDDLAGRGNAPPYDATAFNARVWVRVGVLNAGPDGKLSTGYFHAPCGLVAVQPSVSSTPITTQLNMTVQAGDYKGVKAMNMGV